MPALQMDATSENKFLQMAKDDCIWNSLPNISKMTAHLCAVRFKGRLDLMEEVLKPT